MLAYAYDFIMSSEFRYLDEAHKELIERHIKEREQLAAQGPAAQAGAPAAGGMPGTAPEGPMAGPQPGAPAGPAPQLPSGPANLASPGGPPQ